MMKKTIRTKIILRVLPVVVIGFFIVAVLGGNRVMGILQDNILASEEQRLEQYMQHIQYMQESTENFGKQIASDEVFQLLYDSETDLGINERNKKNHEVSKFLRRYLLLREDCYKIDLVYSDGQYYSSTLKNVDNYLDNDFYRAFKEKKINRGYVGIHDVALHNSPQSNKGLTYIFSTRYIKKPTTEPIDIVLEMNADLFLGEFSINESPVKGFSLYNEQGNCLQKTGEFSKEADKLINKTNHTGAYICDNGNILLVQKDEENNWTANIEIPRKRLEKTVYQSLQSVVFVMIIVCAVLLLVLLRLILSILHPIKELKTVSKSVGAGNLDVYPDIHSGDEFEELSLSFAKMEKNLKNYMEKLLDYEKIKKDMEIDRLVLQINPHFIYNTLNVISYMAQEEGSEKIDEYTRAFIALLQDSVAVRNETYFTTLRQELVNLQNYVTLQKYRYEDRFEIKTEVPEFLLNCRVPNILLQPLVENAIFHGILAKDEKGLIIIQAEYKNEELYIEVRDDGVGMSAETIEEILQDKKLVAGAMRKIGTGNVKNRIRYIYGEKYGMEIKSRIGGGTTIVLHLPCEKTEAL